MFQVREHVFELKEGPLEITLPQYSEALSFQIKDFVGRLWLLVDDTEQKKYNYMFFVRRNQCNIEAGQSLNYLGTCFSDDDAWHIFKPVDM